MFFTNLKEVPSKYPIQKFRHRLWYENKFFNNGRLSKKVIEKPGEFCY